MWVCRSVQQLLQVVYLSDSAGYIPVTPIRSSRHPQSQQPSPSQVSSEYHAAPSSYGGGIVGGQGGPGAELEQWRPEQWDRDYSRRYRHNNTRVQRKCFINCSHSFGHLVEWRRRVDGSMVGWEMPLKRIN